MCHWNGPTLEAWVMNDIIHECMMICRVRRLAVCGLGTNTWERVTFMKKVKSEVANNWKRRIQKEGRKTSKKYCMSQ